MPDSPAAKRPPSTGASKGSSKPGDGATPAETPPVESATAPAGAESAAAEEGPVTSTAKEIFAAALEKKKSAGQSRSAHLDGHGGVGGATASHKATRTFRRKSG